MRTAHFQGIKFLLRDTNPKLFSADRAAFMQVCIADEYGKLLNLIGKGDTVLDLGANIGCFTLLASRKVGKEGNVLAIEADPGNFAQLQSNLAANEVRNTDAVNRAVYVDDGSMIGWHSDGVESKIEIGGAVTVLTCNISTLIDFIERKNSKRIFIKSDMEGAEKYLFNDEEIRQLLKKLDGLAMEVHEKHVFMSIREKLNENGFTISEIHFESDCANKIVRNTIKTKFLPFRLYGKEMFGPISRVFRGLVKDNSIEGKDSEVAFEPGIIYAFR